MNNLLIKLKQYVDECYTIQTKSSIGKWYTLSSSQNIGSNGKSAYTYITLSGNEIYVICSTT
jgi:hypothetical protein